MNVNFVLRLATWLVICKPTSCRSGYRSVQTVWLNSVPTNLWVRTFPEAFSSGPFGHFPGSLYIATPVEGIAKQRKMDKKGSKDNGPLPSPLKIAPVWSLDVRLIRVCHVTPCVSGYSTALPEIMHINLLLITITVFFLEYKPGLEYKPRVVLDILIESDRSALRVITVRHEAINILASLIQIADLNLSLTF